jgi:hypothetical protein
MELCFAPARRGTEPTIRRSNYGQWFQLTSIAAGSRPTDFEIELDMVGDAPACSAKLAAEHRRDEIEEVAAGQRSLHMLFSEDQERLIRDYAAIGISWRELSVFGPVDVRKWEFEPKDFPHEITVE